MIVKNAGPRFSDVLARIKPFVEEIVVLDTGSTDGSLERASDAGAKVSALVVPPEGFHFAHARNIVAKRCQHDLLFVLDADELVRGDPDLFKLKLEGLRHDFYLVDVVTLDGGKPAGRMAQARLYNRTKLYYVGRVHNELRSLLPVEPWPVEGARLPPEAIALEHSGYGADPDDPTGVPGYLRKNPRNLKLLELAWEEGDRRPQVRFQLARTRILAGREAEGLAVLRDTARVGSDLFAALSAMILAEKCAAIAVLGDRTDEAHLQKVDVLLDEVQQLARRFPENRKILMALCRLYTVLGISDGVERTELLISAAPSTFGGAAEIEIFDPPLTL